MSSSPVDFWVDSINSAMGDHEPFRRLLEEAQPLLRVSQTAWEEPPHGHTCEIGQSVRILKEVPLLLSFQGTAGPDPTTVYVDMRALRHDRYCSPLPHLHGLVQTL